MGLIAFSESIAKVSKYKISYNFYSDIYILDLKVQIFKT